MVMTEHPSMKRWRKLTVKFTGQPPVRYLTYEDGMERKNPVFFHDPRYEEAVFEECFVPTRKSV